MSAPSSSAWKIIPTFESRSIERTIKFYVDLLGFEFGGVKPEGDSVNPDDYHFCSVAAGEKAAANIYFFKADGDNVKPSGAYIALGTTQLDIMYESIKAQGDTEIVEDIEDQPWGFRQFTIKDPDGNKLTFFKFLEGGNPGDE